MADAGQLGTGAALPADLTGTTVNRYLVEARLGAGGMGEVYRAEDPTLRRQVAIKRMLRRNGAGAGPSEAERARCLREGQRASTLSHTNIAAIYDVLLEAGEVLLVMEYVAGETLRHRLSSPIALPEFYLLATQCADALCVAHEHGVVHGDIKPENMMLTEAGTLKLLDFGVARRLPGADAATETSLTLANSVAGTSRYMAPELFLGQPPDERTDIFALGVVMYEMISGRHPFAGATQTATIGQILHQEPTAIQTGARIPAPLLAIVDKALAKNPEERYRSARRLAEDLRALQGGRRVRHLTRASSQPTLGWGAVGAGAVLLLGSLVFLFPAVRHVLSARFTSGASAAGGASLLSGHRNLAVLAPTIAGSDPKMEAFAKGLAESVAAKLSELGANHDLAVVPPEELRNKDATTLERARQEFGSTLGLSVSLQSANQQTRAAYSVIDAGSGRILAGSTITAGSSDLFALEDEVAMGVARALKLTLRPEESRALAANATTQPEAYRYFLQGVGYLHDSLNPEELTKAEVLFKEALKLDPHYGAAQAGLGEAYWHRYQGTREAQWIKQAREACQAAVALGNAGAEGHICLGTLDNGSGAYAEAAQEFAEAQQLEPSNDTAVLGLAKAYQKLHQPEKAEQTYQDAIRLRPQYWRGYNSLGGFYITEAEYDKAVASFARAEELAPENYHVSSNLGASLLYLDRDQEAAQAFQRSIAIRPSYFGYQNMGVAYFRLRRFTDAIASYRLALQLQPNDYADWAGLGDALYYGGNEAGAMQAYRKASALAQAQLAVNPQDAEVLGDLASYHSMLGDRRQATQLLERSLQLGHGDKELLFNAAVVYNQLKQKERALDWLAEAIHAGYSRSVVAKAVALDDLHTDPRYITLMRQGAIASH